MKSLEATQGQIVPIGNCLVFEDSTSGILAGKKAGAYVVGVQGNGNQDISQADYQVQSLKEITDDFLVSFRMQSVAPDSFLVLVSSA